MQSNIAAVIEATSTRTSLVIVTKALGFGKDDPMVSILNPMQCLNMKQSVMALTGLGLVTIQGNSHIVPTLTVSIADGYLVIDIYAMEARLNKKEYHRINTVKCSGKGVVVEWYEIIGVHGSMWEVFIPPSFSLVKNKPIGSL
jgi:hypothetical protein